MRIDLACVPGVSDRPNEDYAGVSLPVAGEGGTVVVLDGVTPPADGHTGCRHSVPWFTTRLGGALQETLNTGETSLVDALETAIDRTAAAHRQSCDLSHARTPQATVLLVRWDERRLDYLLLSDTVLLLRFDDGSVQVITDRRPAELPPEMQEQLRKLRLLPQASAQRMAVQRDFRRAAEDLRNVEGGFFTAAADSSVAHRAVIGSVLRAEVNAFASLTDGATRFTEVFRLGDWTDLLAVISEEGTQALINRVRKAELLGDGRTAKIHDDATAVYVAF